jgi:hypothetical protein
VHSRAWVSAPSRKAISAARADRQARRSRVALPLLNRTPRLALEFENLDQFKQTLAAWHRPWPHPNRPESRPARRAPSRSQARKPRTITRCRSERKKVRRSPGQVRRACAMVGRQRLSCAVTGCALGCASESGASSRSHGGRPVLVRAASLDRIRDASHEQAWRRGSTRKRRHLIFQITCCFILIPTASLARVTPVLSVCRGAEPGDDGLAAGRENLDKLGRLPASRRSPSGTARRFSSFPHSAL